MSAYSPPRRLTEDEISDIVSVIPKLRAASFAVAADNHAQVCSAVRSQLREIKIVPEQIPKLKALIYNRAARAHIQPGDTVGLQAAEAIGHPISQGVLNSFHSSGSADVGGMGLQKFTELLNLSSNRRLPKAVIHFLNRKLTFRDATVISRAFVAPTISSLLTDPVLGITFQRRKRGEEVPAFYRAFAAYRKVLNPSYVPPWTQEFEDGVPFVRLTFSPLSLCEASITLEDICSTLHESGGAACVHSASADGIIDVYAKASVTSVVFSAGEAAKRAKAPPKRGVAQGRNTGRVFGVPEGEGAKAARGAAAAEREAEMARREADLPMIDRTITNISREIIATSNIPVQFLQTSVIPRITGDTFVVASKTAQRSLERIIPGVRGVPQIASVLSLFRNVNVVRVKTTSVIRGAVKADPAGKRWRVWVDRQKVLHTGMPIAKIEDLWDVAFPDCSYEWDEGAFAFDLVIPGGLDEDPIERINREFGKANSAFKEATRERITESAKSKKFEPIHASPLQVACEYMHLLGMHNFVQVYRRLVMHPAIDNRTTYTNNFHEIAKVRGIEVARSRIILEFYTTILEAGSSDINPRHVQLVGDVMTGLGVLTPFNARGSVRQKLGAYSESSFEQALPAFQRAGINGSMEPVAATSASILTGSMIAYGTGAFRVVSEGGYKPPDFARELEPEAAVPPEAPPIAAVQTESGVSQNVGVVVSRQDVPTDAFPIPPPGTFGSMRFPPRDPDAAIGTKSTREYLRSRLLEGGLVEP